MAKLRLSAGLGRRAKEIEMARYHGFTCPECGSHYFGTHMHHRAMGDKYEHGTKIGKCHEHQYSGNGCAFEWNRDNPDAEAVAMYEQTPEEWMASFREDMRHNAELTGRASAACEGPR